MEAKRQRKVAKVNIKAIACWFASKLVQNAQPRHIVGTLFIPTVLVMTAILSMTVQPTAANNTNSGDIAQMRHLLQQRSSVAWNEKQKLVAGAGSGAQFGTSIAVDGDTAVIGAAGADFYRGAAYVFVRSGETWTEQAKLTANDGASFHFFGQAVALDGDTAVIGAYGADAFNGAAYVFTRTGTTWTQQARLTAEADAGFAEQFGTGVALEGDTIAVGAQENDGTGAAYIFTGSGATWTQQAKFTASDVAAGDNFGASVALSGDTAIFGAYRKNTERGAAYVFTRSGTAWTQQAKLTADDADFFDWFGITMALDGDSALIGAYNKGYSTGAAYVFTRSGTTWTQQAKLTASDGAASDTFAAAVALDGDTAVVGAQGDENYRGAAYIFTRGGSNWTEQTKLTASDGAAGESFSVVGLDCMNGTIMVGAVGSTSAGAAYVYESDTADCGSSATSPVVFISTWAAGEIDDVDYGPHDILKWDGDAWSKWFDGTEAGLTPTTKWKHNINSIWISGTESAEFAVSFVQNQQRISDLGWVDGYDILWWDGDAFTRWFEGEQVGLNVKTQEKIDGLHVLSEAPAWSEFEDEDCEAYLLISTQGPGVVPKPGNIKPKNVLKFSGEDVLGFCATDLGASTSGRWEMVLDGSADGVRKNNLDSISMNEEGTVLYLTSRNAFSVDDASGIHSMVYAFDMAAEKSVQRADDDGKFSGPLFSIYDTGLADNTRVDALHVVGELALP